MRPHLADPWEHLLWMGAGSVAASYMVKAEAELLQRIEEKVEKAKGDAGKPRRCDSLTHSLTHSLTRSLAHSLTSPCCSRPRRRARAAHRHVSIRDA